MSQNWRTVVNAGDYFGQEKKTLALADRRPVIRKASDLVGPGISSNAVRITDFNNLLATYNGFFSADVGAVNAPNAVDAFAGTTVSDGHIGGVQTFTSLGDTQTYHRTFTRSPLDSSAVFWGDWGKDSDTADLRATALETRAAVLEGRVTALENKIKPLYTGLLYFYMGNQPEGGSASAFAEFGFHFPVLPACWAVRAGWVSGASSTVVSMIDMVNTYYCRVSITNMGVSLATFEDLPVRWYAQEPN